MRVSTEIKNVALNHAIYVRELPREQAEKIRSRIIKKYVNSNSGSFLWDQLKEASVLSDRNGWQKLCEFVGHNISRT